MEEMQKIREITLLKKSNKIIAIYSLSSGNSDDVAKNRANFWIFGIDFWAFLWLKLNSGQHFTLPFLSLFCIKKVLLVIVQFFISR